MGVGWSVPLVRTVECMRWLNRASVVIEYPTPLHLQWLLCIKFKIPAIAVVRSPPDHQIAHSQRETIMTMMNAQDEAALLLKTRL